jgi:hypothetical protein
MSSDKLSTSGVDATVGFFPSGNFADEKKSDS